MFKRAAVATVVLLGLSGASYAQPDVKVDVTRGEGTTTASGTAQMKGTITAIDAASRKVTLKSQTGKVVDLTVGEDARNFDQLRVGDKVSIDYTEALTLSLKKGSGAASMEEREIKERAEAGAKPGGRMGREVTVVAQVVNVNKETKTVTVKGPKGRVVDLHVDDPDQMKNIKKGDRVQAVYTEAVAVSVTPGTAK